MAAPYHPTGYAGPLIFLHTLKGKLLTNNDGDSIGHDCISFTYTYDEEEDDTCEITIQTNNKFLPDLKQFQVRKFLQVTWGYTVEGGGHVLSPTRIIVIRDVNTQYGAQSIKLKLKCTDGFSLLKEIRQNAVRRKNILDWVSEQMRGVGNATLHVHSRDAIRYNEERPALIKTTGLGQFENITTVVESTAAPLIGQFETTRIIKGGSQAIHKQIEDNIKGFSGGPWFIDGRDNNLNIRNRDFEQNTTRTFHYNEEPGDIISLSTKTNFKKNEQENKEAAAVDGVNKKIQVINGKFVEPIPPEDEVHILSTGQSITTKDGQDWWNNNVIPRFDHLVNTGNVLEVAEDKLEPGIENLEEFRINNFEVHYGGEGSGEHGFEPTVQANLLNLNYNINEVGSLAVATEIVPLDDIVVPTAEILSLAIDFEGGEDLAAVNENNATERKQRLYEGDLEIIGDPDLVSSKMIELKGFAVKDNGRWYATKVAHKLSPGNGYTCKLDIIKKGRVSIHGTVTTTTSVTTQFDELRAEARKLSGFSLKKTIVDDEFAANNINFYNVYPGLKPLPFVPFNPNQIQGLSIVPFAPGPSVFQISDAISTTASVSGDNDSPQTQGSKTQNKQDTEGQGQGQNQTSGPNVEDH